MFPKTNPNHKRRVPKRSNRSKFSKTTRVKILEREQNACQCCGGRATQIHHVMPRGRQGRGVYTNGMACCNNCHTKLHADNDLLDYWINVYADRYGAGFYKDEWD